jgi:hypothetical protein
MSSLPGLIMLSVVLLVWAALWRIILYPHGVLPKFQHWRNKVTSNSSLERIKENSFSSSGCKFQFYLSVQRRLFQYWSNKFLTLEHTKKNDLGNHGTARVWCVLSKEYWDIFEEGDMSWNRMTPILGKVWSKHRDIKVILPSSMIFLLLSWCFSMKTTCGLSFEDYLNIHWSCLLPGPCRGCPLGGDWWTGQGSLSAYIWLRI